MTGVRAALLIAALTATLKTHASLVTYQGGYMFTAENQSDSVAWQLAYSPRPFLAVGVEYMFDRMNGATQARETLLARSNYLLKRWNESDSQANIYLFGGLGGVRVSSSNKMAWLAGAETDWESRIFYLSLRGQMVDASQLAAQRFGQLRIGMAPYLTDFESLHSWFIVQAQYWPDALDEKLRVGPILRFYLKNVLWELGVSARGSWTFNTMIHF